jgi:DnaJ-domain-containing protein 1
MPKSRPRRRAPQDPFIKAINKLMGTVDEFLDDALDRVTQGFLEIHYANPQQIPTPPPPPQSRARRQAPTSPPPPPPPHPHATLITLYDVLEVSPRASKETIDAAFRALSKRFHPDKPTGDAEKMKRLSVAHHILSNPQRRAEYDRLNRP